MVKLIFSYGLDFIGENKKMTSPLFAEPCLDETYSGIQTSCYHFDLDFRFDCRLASRDYLTERRYDDITILQAYGINTLLLVNVN